MIFGRGPRRASIRLSSIHLARLLSMGIAALLFAILREISGAQTATGPLHRNNTR